MKQYEDVRQSFLRQLKEVEDDLHNIITRKFTKLREAIILCERCGSIAIADRGTKKFCTDMCRVLTNQGK